MDTQLVQRPNLAMPAVDAMLPAGLGAAVRQLADAVEDGRLSSKLAVALIHRLLPNLHARELVEVAGVPRVVDGASYAEAQRALIAAAVGGVVTPAEGRFLSLMVREAWDATRAEARERHRLR